MGLFFGRLARWLRGRGAKVQRLAFNGGDLVFAATARPVSMTLMRWRSWLRQYMADGGITDVMLFGDCRPIHRVAIRVARRLGVRVWVFEEGYLRPNWITCEVGGVNAYSDLMQDRSWVSAAHAPSPELDSRAAVPNHALTYQAMALQASIYWLAAWLAYPFFRLPHHRSLNAPRELLLWLRGYLRKVVRVACGSSLFAQLSAWRGPVFVLPLQVHNDSQLRVHSKHGDLHQLLREVLQSFARHAPPSAALVVKHHPMDRAYRDYTRFVRSLAADLGVAQRVWVAHDEHLPTLLERSHGCITVNSTVGLQALCQGLAVQTLGRAIYDQPGLTYQGSLDEFWHQWRHARPHPQLLQAFVAHLRQKILINENFYIGLGRFGRAAGQAQPTSPIMAREQILPCQRGKCDAGCFVAPDVHL
ncbi:MAG: capsular biosynthesis protein [Rhodocyclaceae bacterium]|nr:capsular biosynthesis protein [Rhodocyclaceae bacterium]